MRSRNLARYRRHLILSACLGTLVAGANLAPAPSAGAKAPADPSVGREYVLVNTYQSQPEPPLGVIEDPVGIVVGSDGDVFVVDRSVHRAQRFTADGKPIRAYGRPGDEDGELYKPSAVAVDLKADRLYISDEGNGRIAVFQASDGAFVANWGPIVEPESITVGLDGRVFVHTPSTGQILVFNPADGSVMAQFAAAAYVGRRPGTGGALVVGPRGNLFLAMSLGIREFTPAGELVGVVSANPNPAGSPLTRGVTFDAAGDLYVLEEARVARKLRSGVVASQLVSTAVRGIAGGARGILYLIVPRTLDQNAGVIMRQFDGPRQVDVTRWGVPLTVLGWLDQPLRITFGADGDLYVVDDLRRVQRFPANLEAAKGQLVLPGLQEADADANGDLIVARTRYGSSDEDPDDLDAAPAGMRRVRVERYSVEGPLLSAERPAVGTRLWTDDRTEPAVSADATNVMALEHDPRTGQTFVLDQGHKRVLVYSTADGSLVREFPLPVVNAGLPDFTDLTVGPDGLLYVLHTAARHAYRFQQDGTPAGILDVPEWAWRLDIAPDGTLIVPTARRWIWALTPDGRVLAHWLLPEPKFDDPRPPSDVTVSADGKVYVLDQASTAIYVYAPQTMGLDPELPPPSGLTCTVTGEATVNPLEVTMGDPTTVSLNVTGGCAAHRRTGEKPAQLLRTATVSVTLRSDVRLIPNSVHPPAQISGRTLTWQLTDVPPTGMTLQYALTADQMNRYQVFEQASARYLDGWFNYGSAIFRSTVFYTLLPNTPTPVPSATPTATPLPPWVEGRQLFLPYVED